MLTKRILRAVVVLGVLATAAACAGSGNVFDPDVDVEQGKQGDPGIESWSGDSL